MKLMNYTTQAALIGKQYYLSFIQIYICTILSLSTTALLCSKFLPKLDTVWIWRTIILDLRCLSILCLVFSEIFFYWYWKHKIFKKNFAENAWLYLVDSVCEPRSFAFLCICFGCACVCILVVRSGAAPKLVKYWKGIQCQIGLCLQLTS